MGMNDGKTEITHKTDQSNQMPTYISSKIGAHSNNIQRNK